MKVGVTGTREGATETQLSSVRDILNVYFLIDHGGEFHHGDCSGVDVQVAAIAKEIGYTIVCHPPSKDETRGFFGGDIVHDPKGYLERDRNIVDSTEVLLVVPLQDEWQPKGGTWYTHDYAVKKNKPVIIIYPKGVKTVDK